MVTCPHMEDLPQYIRRQEIAEAGVRRGKLLPYGLTAENIRDAMDNILEYLHQINRFSTEHGFDRLEELMLGNTFSGFLSELVVKATARHCPSLVRNAHVGGHPDLLPVGRYAGDDVLRGDEGIEVKVSQQSGGWQGHNPEEAWIMIFQITVDRTSQPVTARQATQFEKVMLAPLTAEHWSFSGRREGSRRTPTASILREGTELLHANAVYERPGYERRRGRSTAR